MKNRYVKNLLKIGIPVLLIGGLIAVKLMDAPAGESKKDIKKGTQIPVNAFIVKPFRLSSDIQAVGTLLPNEEVDLVAETTGKIVGIYFKEVQHVEKGALLLKVDDSDLQAQLKRALFQQKLLSEKLERQRILFEKDAVSREEFDQVQTDYNLIEADISLLKVKIDKTELRAPFAGVLGFRNVSLGAYLQPSTIVTRLVDDGLLKVEFSVPEKYAGKALVGAMVQFTTESSDKKFNASVYAVDSKVDSDTRTISIRARCENPGRLLAPGMFARLNLITRVSNHSLLVPTQSVVPEMEGKKVWMLRNGKAHSTVIETGQRTENKIEVISGLSVGDTILVTGLMQVKEGAAVKPETVE